MICKSCGKAVAPDVKFCPECGVAVVERTGWLPPGAAKPMGHLIDKPPPVKAEEPAPIAPVPVPKTQPNKGQDAAGIGCALALLLGIGYLLVGWCSGPEKTVEQLAAEDAARAENQRNGFHCLSTWDGSNSSLVDKIKSQLRDPDSFEHDETRITPVDDGKHMVMMRYRARNGFGGMNVATAMATVDHGSCQATIITTGE